jgi:ketosteroid isomerase-like protein
MTAENERVAVEVNGEAIHASGEPYNNQYHFLLVIKNGKIVELKEYMDTQLAARILLGEKN